MTEKDKRPWHSGGIARNKRCPKVCAECKHQCTCSHYHKGLHHDGRHVWGITRNVKVTPPELLDLIEDDWEWQKP